MTADQLSKRQRLVLEYLDSCGRASASAIRRATGADANTIRALFKRDLIEHPPGSVYSWRRVK